jgi:hypothetical protein
MCIRRILAASLLAATAALGGAGTAAADDGGFELISLDNADVVCTAPILPILADLREPRTMCAERE